MRAVVAIEIARFSYLMKLKSPPPTIFSSAPAACLTMLTAVSMDHPMKALGGAERHSLRATAMAGTAQCNSDGPATRTDETRRAFAKALGSK